MTQRGIKVLALLSALALVMGALADPVVNAESSGEGPGISAAQIVLDPPTVGMAARSLKIYGSGFTPNVAVRLGLIGVKDGEKAPLLFGAANNYGAFNFRLGGRTPLSAVLKFYKVKPGVYTLIAEGKDGLASASAPFVVVGGKKKKGKK